MDQGDGTVAPNGLGTFCGGAIEVSWPVVAGALVLAAAVLPILWAGRRSWAKEVWDHAIVQSLPVLLPLASVAILLPALSGRCDWWADPMKLAMVLFSGGLITLLGVAAIYRRRRLGSDIARIDRLAYAFRLGGTFALLPFVRHGAVMPAPDAPLKDYREALEEPDFVRLPWVWAFILCTATVFLVSWTFMFQLHLVNGGLNTLLLGGMRLLQDVAIPPPENADAVAFWKHPLSVETIRYMTRGVLWVDLAFLGAYLWSIVYLVWRMAVLDLTGHAFNMITMRIVAAAILAVLFHHLDWSTADARYAQADRSSAAPASQPTKDADPVASSIAPLASPDGSRPVASGTLPASGDPPAAALQAAANGVPQAGSGPLGSLDLWLLVPIACGLMPERVLRRLADLARKALDLGSGGVQMSLEEIDGIDDRYRVRLAEVGIDDAPGLAAANPIRLTMVTPFALPQIVAWIDQAILMTHLGPPLFPIARDRGIRSASAALRRTTGPAGSGLPVEWDTLCADIRADPNWRRLAEIIDRFPQPPQHAST